MDDLIQTERVPVELPNGSVINIEVSAAGRRDVSSSIYSFSDITSVLEGVTLALKSTIDKARPRKATVKFGIEASVEAGKLTAAIVKGSGKANLEITLEWYE